MSDYNIHVDTDNDSLGTLIISFVTLSWCFLHDPKTENQNEIGLKRMVVAGSGCGSLVERRGSQRTLIKCIAGA